MDSRPRIEVFTEGCSSCEGAIAYAHELASSSHEYEVRVWNVNERNGAARNKDVRVADVPAIAVDGELLACCGRADGGTGA